MSAYFHPQVTLVQRALAAQEGKGAGPTDRARPVRDAGGDLPWLCEEDEDLAEGAAAGRHLQEGGQIRQHIDQTGLEVRHEGDVPEGGRPKQGEDTCRHCVYHPRQAARLVPAGGQRSAVHGEVNVKTGKGACKGGFSANSAVAS